MSARGNQRGGRARKRPQETEGQATPHSTVLAAAAPDAVHVERATLAEPPTRAPLPAAVPRLWAATRTRGVALAQSVAHTVRTSTLEQRLWAAVLVLAALLRFWGLGDKPLHHDESMHAYFSLALARDPSSYMYDPLLHGPFQFKAEGLMFTIILAVEALFRAGGPAGHPWINDTTARFLPALFGTALVLLPLGLRRELGRAGALLAALLLAFSPSFVYFSRFLREDIYFNVFMFGMVICAVRYASSRGLRWLVGLAMTTVLAYATFEGIFLTFVIFGAFLAALLTWEGAYALAQRLPQSLSERERLFFSRAGAMLLLGAIGSALALAGLRLITVLNKAIVANPKQADAQVLQLEQTTVMLLLFFSIALALLVISGLLAQVLATPPPAAEGEAEDGQPAAPQRSAFEQLLALPGRWAAHRRAATDPEQQPLLYLLFSMGWVHWFIGFVVAWLLFAALFWVLPGPSRSITLGQGFELGVGRGIWQGLYYWLQQHDVQRGGQPWYYYLLLIPLYEQVGLVFGLAGIVYTLRHPSRFRLFLVWWFIGSLVIYSWAGEKMPWLVIHILLPLMLLGGIALARLLVAARALAGQVAAALAQRDSWRAALAQPSGWRAAGTVASVVALAALTLVTVRGMLFVTQVDAANGPHEMLVYVQTTTDVTRAMNKIRTADRALYGGNHRLTIGVGQGEEWPFYWYLRNYYMDPHPGIYATFGYSPSTQNPQVPDVLILQPGDDVTTFFKQHPTGYSMRQYKLRAWWDEAYKPQIAGAVWGGGVGLGNYLSYGNNPPPNAAFDPRLAAGRLWAWLWDRKPLGSTTGSYDFVLIVRNGLPITP